MREVTASRVLDVTAADLSAWLEPAAIVEAEGSFTVESVEAEADATIVVASGPGIRLPLRFEDRDDAIYYTQEGEHGPFSHMETWLEYEPVDDERTRVTIWSAVELAAPLPFGDRIAAWKRNGELEGRSRRSKPNSADTVYCNDGPARPQAESRSRRQ